MFGSTIDSMDEKIMLKP